VRRPWPLASALLLLGVLGGCSGLLQSNAKPEQTYYLRAPAVPAGAVAASGPAPGASLRVAHPLADPGLDTSHIMLLQNDHRMSFYTGARWPAAMPDLVGSLAVQTLRASGSWSSVEDPASPFPSEYLLQITVRRFDADYSEAPSGSAAPAVQVVFDCSIGRREGREVLSTFVVAGSATAAANRLGEVVAAFEQATDTALQQLAQQAGAAVRAAAEHAAQNGAAPAPSSNRHSQ
jgi:cholesterol transport system auxiliary component